MFGFSTTELILVAFVIYLGGKDVIKILALIPGFAPLAQALEKLNGNGKNGNGKNGHDDLKVMMKELQQHFNEDTTQALKDIKEAIEKHSTDETPILTEISKNIALLLDRTK